MATATDSQLLTPQQLFSMTDAQRNAYYASLSPDQAAQEKAALQNYIRQVSDANRAYLQQSTDKYAVCPASGGATSNTYAAGSTLNYNFPTAGGAYIREFEILFDIKFTPAAGSSATYSWSAAGAYAWVTEIDIIYNGQQARIRPYFLKILDVLRFKMWLPYAQVLSGLNADSGTTSNVSQAQPSLTGGSAATSKFRIRLPLQLMRWSPVGCLPAQGQGTKGQINLITASTLVNTGTVSQADPMLVPIVWTGGTGPGVTLDSTEKTITIFAIYNDGTNFGSKTPLALHLEGLPTVQYVIDQQLNPLTSGTVVRQRITTLQKHVVAASVIIDGQSATAFCATSNIASIELDQDSAGQNKFYQYGTPNNTTLYDYYERIRHELGQDLDPGVILWINALHWNTVNTDNSNGTQILNMSPGNWTDVNYGMQITTVSTTFITPRVETFLFTINDAGLVLG